MKAKVIFISFLLVASMCTFGQDPTIELSFTAIDSTEWIQLDSVKVMNRTQGGDTVLYYPDTVLVLYYVGVPQIQEASERFSVHSYPNPVTDQMTISLFIPQEDMVKVCVTNILGSLVISQDRKLARGTHTFSFAPGEGQLYFFTALWKEHTRSVKIVNVSFVGRTGCSLSYSGYEGVERKVKELKTIQGFEFNLGDELLYIGNIDTLESGMPDTPETSQSYTFQFATNIPCPGTPTVTYEGQVYNTIQIFSQCWMKENLNVGIMIQSTQSQTNNDTIEKYCMSDNEYYCNNFVGGLYFWDEMMKYTNEPGGQGICPEGWHIPDDLDWQILEGAVDSEYKIGDPEWESYVWRGTDAGGNLKQTGTTNWEPPNTGATDAFGFTALPGGYFVQNAFWGPGYKGIFWSSAIAMKYYRNMDWNQAMIKKGPGSGDPAFSVRCIKD